MKRTEIKRTAFKSERKPMKRSRPKTTPARQAARGRECQIRVPGYCEPGNDTVVLCHYRLGDGKGVKPDDEQGAWGCATCHALVDGRMATGQYATDCQWSHDQLRLMHAEGVFRTQKILRDERLT